MGRHKCTIFECFVGEKDFAGFSMSWQAVAMLAEVGAIAWLDLSPVKSRIAG